jgi:RHS repeat-associated protein
LKKKERNRYNGKELVEGIGWYDYGARMYDPTIGRWSAIDPLAELDFHLGSYVYVGNDPVNSVDMFGMYKKKIKEDTYEETVPFDEVTVTAKETT